MRVVQFKRNKKTTKEAERRKSERTRKWLQLAGLKRTNDTQKTEKLRTEKQKIPAVFKINFFFPLIIRSNGEHLKRWKKKETNKVQKGIYQKSETYYERHISIFNVNNRRITKGWIEKTCTRHWGGLVIQ